MLTAGKLYVVSGYKIKTFGCEDTTTVHWLHFLPQNKDTHRALCSLLPNPFLRVFSALLSITPGNLITQLRMHRALMLTDQRLSIKEISYELGSCNDVHFSRIFKRYSGFPPRLYRSSELLSNEFAKQLQDDLR